MATLEKVTAAAPPEIRVQSGIATRILWGQILYPSNQPASARPWDTWQPCARPVTT